MPEHDRFTAPGSDPAVASVRGQLSRAEFLRLLGASAAAAAVGPALADAASADTAGSAAPVAPGAGAFVSPRRGPGRFALVTDRVAAPLVVSSDDFADVRRAVGDLQNDIVSVTGVQPTLVVDQIPAGALPVLVGTLGRSPLIDGLVAGGRLDVSGIAGRWETSLQQVVQNPAPDGVAALVIAGSDQRGTIFGVYEVSKQIGVSPWYWWDDVAPLHRDELFVLPGRHSQGTPVVKYRGFFINDENPNLGGWGPAYFGPGLAPGHPDGFHSKLYARVFELMLRLKANYLWPAVWGRAFAEDDPANHATVTEYGIVMGTSHEADYAWNPDALTIEDIPDWERAYAAQNFSAAQAAAIGEVLHTYSRLQSRRKPELLNRRITVDPTKNISTDPKAVVYNDQATPFSLTDYQELDRATEQWQQLADRAERIGARLPAATQDAYYELVLYEVAATANLYALRRAQFTNIFYAAQGRALTNDLADAAEARFADDLGFAEKFNTKIAGGKWQRFQTQPHIDYGDVARYGPNATWQEPESNGWAIPDVIFPALQRIALPSAAQLCVAIDGSDSWWPGQPGQAGQAGQGSAVLPEFSPFQSQPAQFIDVFNRGSMPFHFRIDTGVRWLTAHPSSGTVDKQTRATLNVDWRRAPAGTTQVPITVTGSEGTTVTVTATVFNPDRRTIRGDGFVEANGYVSIEADHYTRAVGSGAISWAHVADIGRTGCGMQAVPVTAPSQTPGGSSPRLEYAPINGWTVRWTLASGQSITQLWNGSLSTSGSSVTVTNASYNGALAAGASTTFGFTAAGSPSNPRLTCTSP